MIIMPNKKLYILVTLITYMILGPLAPWAPAVAPPAPPLEPALHWCLGVSGMLRS